MSFSYRIIKSGYKRGYIYGMFANGEIHILKTGKFVGLANQKPEILDEIWHTRRCELDEVLKVYINQNG